MELLKHLLFHTPNPGNINPFPCDCLLCGDYSMRDIGLCVDCNAGLPWIPSGCRTCGLPLPAGTEEHQCGECQTGKTFFTLAVIPLFYQKPVNRIITTFKHQRGLAEGRLLAQLLTREIRDHYVDGNMPEVIIPVPLHWQRFLWRGYNQSAELGRQLGKELDIPCHSNVIKRQRRTPSQQGLNREQRLHNLRGAFRVEKRSPFKRVALLDDVVTTGSTTSEIAKLLLSQGATEVHLWAIARTPAAR